MSDYSRSSESSIASQKVDAYIEHYGSIFLVRPVSSTASNWLTDNVSEDSQYFGNALVVEPRYLVDLVQGMQENGLVLR